jgi:hypothetical protein
MGSQSQARGRAPVFPFFYYTWPVKQDGQFRERTGVDYLSFGKNGVAYKRSQPDYQFEVGSNRNSTIALPVIAV